MSTAADPLELTIDYEPGFRNPHPATDFDRLTLVGGPVDLIGECVQDRAPFTLTCPDGGKIEWVGVMGPISNGRAKLLADPDTLVYTPGPWLRRLKYRVQCLWWKLTRRWK